VYYSEEQQPLENFFRAKGIKTKNEMADDVRLWNPSHDLADHMFSLARYSQRLSRMKISLPVTMEVLQTAAAPTKTMRVLTRTFALSLNRRWERNLMKITRVAPTVTRKWLMGEATNLSLWSARRRNRRRRRNDTHPLDRQGICGEKSGDAAAEDDPILPRF
jgi:hypothetical protein